MRRKKYLFLCVLCMLLCLILGSSVYAASPKLSKKSIVLYKGETQKLTLKSAKGKVKWESSDEAVATVSSKGKVKALKAGHCVIRVTNKKKVFSCNVTVYDSKMDHRVAGFQKLYKPENNQNKIVLAGSSSIQRWVKAAEHFKPYKTVNLGVSGSKVEDWQAYYSTIVRYNPKALVIYLGGNNITKNKHGLGAKTSKAMIQLLDSLHAELPETMIYYVSIHPSRKRWDAWKETKICNKAVKEYCDNSSNVTFIDITSACMKKGLPDKSLVVSDKLHFNEAGYKKIWKNIVAKKVIHDLKKAAGK